jgi:ELWxxDGT repeat protein
MLRLQFGRFKIFCLQKIKCQNRLPMSFIGFASVVVISFFNGLLLQPQVVLSQARPILLESISIPEPGGPDRSLVQGDFLYSLRQTTTKGSKSSHDELWIKDGLSEKRLYSWPDRPDDLQIHFLGQVNQSLLLFDRKWNFWRYDGKAIHVIAKPGSALSPSSGFGLGMEGQLIWASQGFPEKQELWRFDGKTLRSAYRFPALAIGQSYPKFFTLFKDTVLFSTGLGDGLWRLDGQNKKRIAPINFTSQLTTWGDRLFMEAETKAEGLELWSSDGKTAQSLGDLNPGPWHSDVHILGGRKDLMFFANTPKGQELFATQGTIATTRSVKVINSQPTKQTEYSVARLGDRLFFSVNVGQGSELWVSDGTTTQTIRLAQFPSQFAIHDLTVIGDSNSATLRDRVLFSATDDNGQELWVSDGTSQGTRLLRDISPGTRTSEVEICSFSVKPPDLPCHRQSVTQVSSSRPQHLTAFKDKVYFVATIEDPPTGERHHPGLWVSDGTDQGTRFIQELPTGVDQILPLTNWMEIRSFDFLLKRERRWTLREFVPSKP